MGLVSGILTWFVVGLIVDWDGNVKDFKRGQDAAKEHFQSIENE